MVNTKSHNDGEASSNNTTGTPGGITNKAYLPSNSRVYTISKQLSDSTDMPTVESTKNLLNQYPSSSANLNMSNSAFINKNIPLTNKISKTNSKCINRPKLVIPLVLIGIVLSIAAITGVVYAVVSSKPKESNSNQVSTFPIFNTTILTTFISAASTEVPTTEYDKRKELKECGVPRISPNLQLTRIMRGHAAVRDSWPWTVSIGYYGPRTSLPHACGGALVNKRFIVTATHCVQSESIFTLVGKPVESHPQFGSLERMMRVYVGVNTRSTDINSENTYRVESILEHPNFDPNTFKNDLAIIKLDRDVTDTENLNFICVPNETNTEPGTEVYAVGWGFTENNFYRASDTLNQVKIQIQTTSSCGLTYIPVLQFCAGNPTLGKDTCNGDSGGPIMQLDKQKRWNLVGVVSNGDSLCTGRGIYTNISFYNKWIQDNTKITILE